MKNVFDVARWFIEYNPFLSCHRRGYKDSHLKIEKLLYYSNTLMKLLYKKTLFSEELVAYKEGFVVEEFYSKYRNNEAEVYNHVLIDNFTEEEKEILNLTNIMFGYMTGQELSTNVHLDDIWNKYKDDASMYNSHRVLDIEDINKYYKTQEIFMQDVQYLRENISEETRRIRNITAQKPNHDDVYFYYDRSLEINEETRKLFDEIIRECATDSNVKYFYVYRDERGVLHVE